MQEISLEAENVETLLFVLEQNTQAVNKGDSLRWTPASAERINDIKEEIAVQTE